MAVSHQWFIQWSLPSAVYSDINNQYNKVNPSWTDEGTPLVNSHVRHDDNNYILPYRNPTQRLEHSKHYKYLNDENKKYYNESTKAASAALWLTMLGLAQTHPVHRLPPTDSDTHPFTTLFRWKHIDFEADSIFHLPVEHHSPEFIPANVLPLGLEVTTNRVFITLPHWREGVPVTLASVSLHSRDSSPPLAPYPNWNYQMVYRQKKCSGLVSVFRINLDKCNRLWVLDSGIVDAQDKPKQLCPPRIFVFDTKTDIEVGRYQIPAKYVFKESLFTNIIVDARRSGCIDAHAYIADTWGFGLLVFREKDRAFWRFSHPFFHPDPLASNFTIHSLNFQWADGILGLALSPLNRYEPYEDRTLYFHSLSGYREFYVSTQTLQNPYKVNESFSEFHVLGESRGLFGQASGSAIDKRGVLYYGLVSQDSVGCWNIKTPYIESTNGIVARNTETLFFPNDIRVEEKSHRVYVLSNRLPLFQAKQLDPDDYNFRILYAEIGTAVEGTVCNSDRPRPLPER